MKFVYFDASAGLSGDMILAALLDLGVPPPLFKKKIAGLKLPVEIRFEETRRASLRGLKVDVLLKRKKAVERRFHDIEILISGSAFSTEVKKNALAVFRNLFTAEARVHGRKFQEAHLHEAGADDHQQRRDQSSDDARGRLTRAPVRPEHGAVEDRGFGGLIHRSLACVIISIKLNG